MSWKSEFVHNYKSREVDNIEDESKVERKIRFSPSVKVKLFKDDECSPDPAKAQKVKLVELKS